MGVFDRFTVNEDIDLSSLSRGSRMIHSLLNCSVLLDGKNYIFSHSNKIFSQLDANELPAKVNSYWKELCEISRQLKSL